MVQPITAPYASTYTAHEPYLTRDEYITSPNAVDASRLVQGSQANQEQALTNVIAKASNWADVICHQVLAATPETWTGYPRIRIGEDTQIPLTYSPIVQVTGFSVGPTQAALTPANDLTGITIMRKVLHVPAPFFGSQTWPNTRSFAQVDYIAGFANALLTVAAAAGDSTLTVDNTAGIVPGMTLSINDPVNLTSEVVTVSTTTATTVSLAAPILSPHEAGVNVSAMPEAIKQAVVFLTTALIKRRSANTINIQSGLQAPAIDTAYPSGGAESRSAAELLNEFARVV